MNKEELNVLFFYCNVLGINTLGKLNFFKKITKARNNEELLDQLKFAYCGR